MPKERILVLGESESWAEEPFIAGFCPFHHICLHNKALRTKVSPQQTGQVYDLKTVFRKETFEKVAFGKA